MTLCHVLLVLLKVTVESYCHLQLVNMVPVRGIREAWIHLVIQLIRFNLVDLQPRVAQPVFRTSQDLASSCKSSCRRFGFSLVEGRHDATKEENMVQATSSLSSGAFLDRIGGQFHSKPAAMANTVGSNCTKVSNLYAVRDVFFDIAL